MSGKLVLVGTPIGNLEDFSPRALRALQEADFIAAEDTRVSRGLCTHFGVQKPMVSYFEHNARRRGEEIVRRIEAGEVCALVTDAGMPCISDPGEDIVALCAERNLPVEVVPGPNAAVSALAVSGLPTGRFVFEGFLGTDRRERDERLRELCAERRTIIFYEAPHRLVRTLEDLYAAFGERRTALVRELTKIHEETLRLPLSKAAAHFREAEPRGEYVIIVEGALAPAGEEVSLEEAVSMTLSRAQSGVPLPKAAREVAALTGYARAALYSGALRAREDGAEGAFSNRG